MSTDEFLTMSTLVFGVILSLHFSRGVPHLLAAFLCDSHTEHPLQDMLRASRALQCFHLAGVRQQRPQPGYLHHLQHRVQTGLHQDPQLLRHAPWALKVYLSGSDHRCWLWHQLREVLPQHQAWARRGNDAIVCNKCKQKRKLKLFFFSWTVTFVQYYSSNETYFHMHSVLSIAQGFRLSCGYALHSVCTVTGTVSSTQGFTEKRFGGNMELSSRCKDSIVIKYHDRQHEAIQWGSRCLCSVFRRVIVIFQRALLQPCFSLKFKKWTETVSSTRAQGARANLFQVSQWAAHQPVKRGQAAREKYSLYMMPCILWLRLEVGRDKQEGEEKRKKNTKKNGGCGCGRGYWMIEHRWKL